MLKWSARHCLLLVIQLWLCLTLAISKNARAEEKTPRQLDNVTVIEKLGTNVNLEMAFTDQNGQKVKLGDYFKDGVPVLLSLNYYQCQSLCSLQLNGLLEGLKGLDWAKEANKASVDPGAGAKAKAAPRFRMVTVSIDPRNTPAMALEKQKMYLDALNRPGLDWSFLVGTEENVRALANSVGFQYRYDAETNQFAHTAAIYFLSAAGGISRYLYGIEYSARDIKFALMDASEGRLGSSVEQLILRCFHYDELLGKYAPIAMNSMRAGGAVTVLALGIFLIILWRREKSNRRGEYAT